MIKRIQEIKKELNETTEISLKFFSTEFKKFIEKLETAIKEFNAESVKIKRDLVEKDKILREYQEKTENIKEEYTIYKKKVGDLNKKSEELGKREDELLNLHKTLINRGKVLDAKEKETKF